MHQATAVALCVIVAIAVIAYRHITTSIAREPPPLGVCPFTFLRQSCRHLGEALHTATACPSATTQQFKQQFACIVSDQVMTATEKHRKLNLLCAAFLIRRLALQLKGVGGHAQSKSPCPSCAQAISQAQAAHAAQVKAENQVDVLQAAAAKAQSTVMHLTQQAVQHREAIMQLQCRVDTLRQQMSMAELRCRCAPAYFDQLIEFMKVRCVTGSEMKVGSAELHQAFESFMKRAHRGQPGAAVIAAPTQRELRALMESLGFEYTQLYHNGANTRCLRGIQLRLNSHGT
jgi:hypothetical protein